MESGSYPGGGEEIVLFSEPSKTDSEPFSPLRAMGTGDCVPGGSGLRVNLTQGRIKLFGAPRQ